jgi:hypothetical protein
VHRVPLQLTSSGTKTSISAPELATLRREFDRQHCLLLPALLSQDLVGQVLQRIASGQFHDVTNDGVGHDMSLPESPVVHALHLAVNDPPFLRVLEDVTSARPLGRFDGRIYRMVPGAGHGMDWHDDLHHDHRLGLSINLTPAEYEGGTFQMRLAGASAILCEVRNVGLGDAILFRLDRQLEHRVTPLAGDVAKTAFAGWFSAGKAYWEGIGEHAAERRGRADVSAPGPSS